MYSLSKKRRNYLKSPIVRQHTYILYCNILLPTLSVPQNLVQNRGHSFLNEHIPPPISPCLGPGGGRGRVAGERSLSRQESGRSPGFDSRRARQNRAVSHYPFPSRRPRSVAEEGARAPRGPRWQRRYSGSAGRATGHGGGKHRHRICLWGGRPRAVAACRPECPP